MFPYGLTFAHPKWLLGLLFVLALTALFVWGETQARRQLALLLRNPRLRAQLTSAASPQRRRARFALLLAGLACLWIALAGPRLGYEEQTVRRKGLDLMLLVDVSKSMLATDLTPNRLARVKLATQDLIGQLESDRLGLVAFAGTAFLETPLTVDYDAALVSLADLDTESIPRGGTNLAGAIDLALEAFGKAEADNRAIILMTDGEATEGETSDSLQAAERAKAAGAKVFTVGAGTPEGSLIPLPGTNGEFVRNQEGKMVQSKLNEETLREIAKAAGGTYVRLQNGQAEMRTLAHDGLGRMKAGELDARLARRPIERYQWPLGAGLLCLAAAALIGERRRIRAAAVAPRPARVAAAALAAVLALFTSTGRGAPTPAASSAPAASGDPMALYRDGNYAEAYRAFKDMAAKSPDRGNLQFDAGASAFKEGKYDDALNAFSEAMTSDDPVLQAKSHYNFGNTLFKRGEKLEDQKTKVQDWRNAIEHYNSALSLLKADKNNPLARDTAYNRDLVQRVMDEELKPKPTPPPQNKPPPDKDKPQDKDKKPPPPKPEQSPQDKPSQDQNKSPDQQNKPDQKPGQDAPPQQQDQNGQPKSGDPAGSDSNQPPPQQPQDQSGQPKSDPGKEQGKPGEEQPKPGQGSPDPNDPAQDQQRQRGDLKAQPGEPKEGKGQPQEAKEIPAGKEGEAPPEPGKMNAAQAAALLEALKGEDDRVDLSARPKRREEPVYNDW